MVMRIRSAALLVCAFVVSAWAAVLLPAATSDSLLAVGAAAVLALAVVASVSARVPLPALGFHVGPPSSAQRRRRGSFLRQSNPDTPGRARPRAPGRDRF
ncbi:DUF6412 domain-containing protein [Nocardia sp. NPDC003482]|uniref:DUF6412 domain-containing protein n=1 Tax=Nocardia sp. NPDC004068 TaxID=3364303 RepID=UPI0036CF647F